MPRTSRAAVFQESQQNQTTSQEKSELKINPPTARKIPNLLIQRRRNSEFTSPPPTINLLAMPAFTFASRSPAEYSTRTNSAELNLKDQRRRLRQSSRYSSRKNPNSSRRKGLEDVRQVVRDRFRRDDSRNKTRTTPSLVLNARGLKFFPANQKFRARDCSVPLEKIARPPDCTQLVQRVSAPAFSVVFDSPAILFHTVFNRTVENFHAPIHHSCLFPRTIWRANCLRIFKEISAQRSIAAHLERVTLETTRAITA